MGTNNKLKSCCQRNFQIEKPHLLIVEGKDDYQFFESFLEHLNLLSIQIFCLDGKNNLNNKLKALVRLPNFSLLESIGITRDSDDNPIGAFQSIQSALKNAGLAVPKEELTLAGKNPRISICLIPGINQEGSLEDLCLEAIAEAQDRALDCVDAYFSCLRKNKIKFSKKVFKAKVQVFLASRREYIPDLGIAAKRSVWPWDSHVFAKIKDFLFDLASK
ncbi:MAG: DUF3226 domain-containing protein [Candidatus Saccharicenans sp.]